MERKGLNRDSEGVVAYEGGSFRERIPGKGLYHCIPANGMRRVAQRYEYGKIKYGNASAYKDGLPVSDCLDSIFRHLWAYLEGDNSEDHLAAVVWGCLAIMYYEEVKPQWQDIPARKRYSVKRGSFNYIQKDLERMVKND